jgi:hypothetical protein
MLFKPSSFCFVSASVITLFQGLQKTDEKKHVDCGPSSILKETLEQDILHNPDNPGVTTHTYFHTAQ